MKNTTINLNLGTENEMLNWIWPHIPNQLLLKTTFNISDLTRLIKLNITRKFSYSKLEKNPNTILKLTCGLLQILTSAFQENLVVVSQDGNWGFPFFILLWKGKALAMKNRRAVIGCFKKQGCWEKLRYGYLVWSQMLDNIIQFNQMGSSAQSA